MVRRTIRHRATLHRLFHEIGPRFVGRDGGYTRIVKMGHRAGDAAPISLIELMPALEAVPAEPPKHEPTKKGKGKQ
jgi:large subunit ribosomal protein L17